MRLIVYHDDKYPEAWILSEQSKKITDFLKGKNFLEYNAEDLGKWMEKSVEKKTCHESLVVFSQDIIPDTVCHNTSPSALIRAYLDSGGSVVWIGEIPCYYQGLSPSNENKLKIDVEGDISNRGTWKTREGKFGKGWSRVGSFGVLGILPVYFDFPSSKVSITKKGKSLGLKTPWYGHRPVVIKGSNLRRKQPMNLASGNPGFLMPTQKAIFREEREKKIPFKSLFEYTSKLIGLVPAVIALITALVSLIVGFEKIVTLSLAGLAFLFFLTYLVYWFFRQRERFANAWFKNFDPKHPASGLIRIWDFQPYRITESMLDELCEIALSPFVADNPSETT